MKRSTKEDENPIRHLEAVQSRNLAELRKKQQAEDAARYKTEEDNAKRRAALWSVDKYPFRNRVCRGVSVLHGLALMDWTQNSLWVRAYNRDAHQLGLIVMQVIQSQVSENDFPKAVLDVVMEWMADAGCQMSDIESKLIEFPAEDVA